MRTGSRHSNVVSQRNYSTSLQLHYLHLSYSTRTLFATCNPHCFLVSAPTHPSLIGNLTIQVTTHLVSLWFFFVFFLFSCACLFFCLFFFVLSIWYPCTREQK